MSELSKARIRAHAYFDRLWIVGIMSRKEAYMYLRSFMSTNHIGNMSVRQCKKLIKRLRKDYPELYQDDTFLELFQ